MRSLFRALVPDLTVAEWTAAIILTAIIAVTCHLDWPAIDAALAAAWGHG